MNISDEDFDKVISGKAGASGPEANEVASITRRLNSTYVSPISSATEAKHLQAIRQANAGRTATGSKPADASGPLSVLDPFKNFLAGMRRLGFLQLSGSTAVWAVVAALFLVSTTGGLAAAGVLPERMQSAVSSAARTVGIQVPGPAPAVPGIQVSEPEAPGQVKVTEGDPAAQQAALASAEQAIAAAEQAQRAAQEAAATSARCMEESMAQVSALVEGILGATSPAQAQAMVAQAKTIGTNVKSCSDQASAIGRNGVVFAAQAAELAHKASGASPAMTPEALASVHSAGQAARMAETSASQALSVSRSIVDNVSGLAASLVSSSIGLQQLPTAPAPAGPAPAASQPFPPGGSVASPPVWANWGVDYSNQIMRSFQGGAGRRR